MVIAPPFVDSSPLPKPDLDIRQFVNGTDLKASFDSSCWNTFSLEVNLNDPETGWNRTAAICTSDDDDAACCLPTEPWTTCYLRLAHGFPGTDCSEINAQDCSYAPSLAVDPRIALYVAYTVKTIYGTFSKVPPFETHTNVKAKSNKRPLHNMVQRSPIRRLASPFHLPRRNHPSRSTTTNKSHSPRPSRPRLHCRSRSRQPYRPPSRNSHSRTSSTKRRQPSSKCCPRHLARWHRMIPIHPDRRRRERDNSYDRHSKTVR